MRSLAGRGVDAHLPAGLRWPDAVLWHDCFRLAGDLAGDGPGRACLLAWLDVVSTPGHRLVDACRHHDRFRRFQHHHLLAGGHNGAVSEDGLPGGADRYDPSAGTDFDRVHGLELPDLDRADAGLPALGQTILPSDTGKSSLIRVHLAGLIGTRKSVPPPALTRPSCPRACL